ncbi:unnamed protein product [Polarella glacialis]|uniref:Uncharacterized protein n=1 Tax=Polarella glacialis TaxID=89957 RepID=A0A813L6X5_POLGL|nr:unnamed protein product [Polarella glacialis]
MYSLRVVLPGIVLSLTSLRVLLSAGATTDYCVKLPSLFTTVRTSSPQLEKGLLRLVQFLHATEAGFYVSETKISSSGILKGAYVTALVCCCCYCCGCCCCCCGCGGCCYSCGCCGGQIARVKSQITVNNNKTTKQQTVIWNTLRL